MISKVRGPLITSAVIALRIVAFGSGASAEDVGKTTSSQLAPSRFAYARLYCTPDHESHFAALTADLAEQNFAPPAAPIYIGGSQPAASVFFAGIRGALGRRRPGEPPLPSDPRSSAAYRGCGRVLDHNVRRRVETAARRRRRPSGRRRALQRAHYGCGRHDGVPGVRSLTAARGVASFPAKCVRAARKAASRVTLACLETKI